MMFHQWNVKNTKTDVQLLKPRLRSHSDFSYAAREFLWVSHALDSKQACLESHVTGPPVHQSLVLTG